MHSIKGTCAEGALEGKERIHLPCKYILKNYLLLYY